MNDTLTYRPHRQLPLRFVAGVAIALALALAAFVLVMRPPAAELRAMAGFLAITALISVLAGYGAYRLGWLSRSPRLTWTLLAGYALAALLTYLNVGFSARLMFASQHDLLLAGVLLVFAGGIAMALGYFVAAAVTDRIAAVCIGAEALASGDLSARVPVVGNDEVSHLARTFNEMAERLQETDRKQRELDILRRDLIAWAGHDLRTPLASTRVIVEALADGVVDDPDTVQRYLRTAQRDIQSLSLLIDDLFDLAQMDAGGSAAGAPTQCDLRPGVGHHRVVCSAGRATRRNLVGRCGAGRRSRADRCAADRAGTVQPGEQRIASHASRRCRASARFSGGRTGAGGGG